MANAAGLTAPGANVERRTRERTPASLRALVSMERIKIVKRPMTWITLLILVAATAAIVILAYVTIHASNIDPVRKASRLNNFILPTGIQRSFEISGFFGQIVLVVIAASMVGAEFSWGTIRMMVGTGVARSKLLLAKLIALTLTTIVFLVLAVAAGTFASFLVTVISGHTLTLGTVNSAWWGDLALMTVRGFFVLWVMMVLAFSIASITRSTAAGIAVGIGWPFLERIGTALLGLIGSIGDTINKWLISTNSNALIAHSGFGPQTIAKGTPTVWHAFGVLLLYSVVLLAITFAIFRKRDIASGS
ncbi:MAG TPA: ABC transporter permease subunit [Nitrolancea sp.]|nr:ABC transporter permease subunit [Nitrolancea sp.]